MCYWRHVHIISSNMCVYENMCIYVHVCMRDRTTHICDDMHRHSWYTFVFFLPLGSFNKHKHSAMLCDCVAHTLEHSKQKL